MARFKEMRPAEERREATVALPQQTADPQLLELARMTQAKFSALLGGLIDTQIEGRPLDAWRLDGDHAIASAKVLQQGLWDYLRRELSVRPEWVAGQVGIPELVRLADVEVRPV